MTFNYYYNNVPELGKCRNNLIYTSLINVDKTVFCQWYHNDEGYHGGHNEVVDVKLMDDKWQRELKYLQLMRGAYPDLVPKVLDIDYKSRKIYLEIENDDFWEQSGCITENYSSVLPNWQEQMLDIIKAHKSLGLYKYSMHPSSYFVVKGKLKSINYFFTYHKSEPEFSISDIESHISTNRRTELKKYLESLGMSWDVPNSHQRNERLCWESFRSNYPSDFIEKVLCLL